MTSFHLLIYSWCVALQYSFFLDSRRFYNLNIRKVRQDLGTFAQRLGFEKDALSLEWTIVFSFELEVFVYFVFFVLMLPNNALLEV